MYSTSVQLDGYRVRLYFGVRKSLHTGERTVLLYFFMINVMISYLNDNDSALYIVLTGTMLLKQIKDS